MKTLAATLAVLVSSFSPSLAQTAHPAHRHSTVPSVPACPPAAAAPVVPPGLPPAPGAAQTAFALRYVDIQPGTRDLATPGEFLTVQYTGWLASNGTKFDSSVDRNEPFTFPQGAHRVIPGWDQGFGGMRVGGKRRLFIPYQLAYGEEGRPPVIPPASDLIFDIELVAASSSPPQPVPPPQQPATPPEPAKPPQPQR